MAVSVNMIPLENVFNYIPNNLRRTYNDDDQILSYALQAWRNIGVPARYIKDIAFLEVKDHKADIPEDTFKIVSVWKIKDDADFSYLYDCADEPEHVITEFDTYCTINYRLFKTKETDNFERLKYAGNYGDSYVCLEAHKGHCGETWSVSVATRQIQTSIKDGIIMMYYFKEPKNEEGQFLLPATPIVLWEYLAASVCTKIWEDRLSIKEESSAGIYVEYKRQQTNYLKEVRGYFKGKSINYDNLKGVIYSQTDLIRVPYTVMRRYNKAYLNGR